MFASVLTSIHLNGQNNTKKQDWKLIWSDEFNVDGKPNSNFWNFENGFIRNNEAQWYQEKNAYCKNGILIIEGKREKIKNTKFDSLSQNWRKKREFGEYTSASINTQGKKEFLYARFEIRAKIDTLEGLWPAIWTLGTDKKWPSNGEIDIMECYPINGESCILANVACGTLKPNIAKWNSKNIVLKHFLKKDKHWISKFHVWRMDWDKDFVKIYLDGERMNSVSVEEMKNPDGFYPLRQPHYILLNLAIGGDKGGNPEKTPFPTTYEIDYVRVYQK